MTNESLAQASDYAIWAAVVVLVPAMLAFLVHLALTGARATTSTAGRNTGDRERVAVGAAGEARQAGADPVARQAGAAADARRAGVDPAGPSAADRHQRRRQAAARRLRRAKRRFVRSLAGYSLFCYTFLVSHARIYGRLDGLMA